MKTRVSIISDLHLFCCRSRAPQHLEAVHQAARGSGRLVLVGDIFDFRWTVFDSVETTVDHALAWLEDLCRNNPDTVVHYVLGNHDWHVLFTTALRELERKTPNLSVEEQLLRLGDAVFLHGDIALGGFGVGQTRRARRNWEHDPKKGRLITKIYDVAAGMRITKLIYLAAFPKRAVVRKLARFLEATGQGPDSGVRCVFFGHTHLVLDYLDARGVRYRNCGAPLPGVTFNIIQTDIEV